MDGYLVTIALAFANLLKVNTFADAINLGKHLEPHQLVGITDACCFRLHKVGLHPRAKEARNLIPLPFQLQHAVDAG